jgi:hypothetical protein
MTDTGYKFESDEKRVYNVISTCVGMLVIVRLVIEKLSQVAAGVWDIRRILDGPSMSIVIVGFEVPRH